MASAREGDERTNVLVTIMQTRHLTIGAYVNERAAGRLGISQENVTDETILGYDDAHTIAFDLENVAGLASGEVEDHLPEDDPRINVGDLVRIGIAAYRKQRAATSSWPYPLPG
ncbi:MAG: hypothetical protein Q7R90_02305 [bacterium]|nr:hypothetical protein [bacterium]